MELDQLTATLAAIGKPGHVVEVSGGARVLLLPHGGRVLGLFAGNGGENFYWTNPALESTARGWPPRWNCSFPPIPI
jgi:hypothetical protein